MLHKGSQMRWALPALLAALLGMVGLLLAVMGAIGRTLGLIGGGLGVIGLALQVFALLREKHNMAAPIAGMRRLAKRVAEGDIAPEPLPQAGGALAALAGELMEMESALDRQITHMTRSLRRVAHYGDFTFRLDMEYSGRFAPIHDSMEELIESLLDTFSQMREVSNSVYGLAQQILSYGEEISASSSEQAASIEEISATTAVISQGITDSANDINTINIKTQDMGARINNCKTNMDEVIRAMDHMERSASQIAHITKTIDDIAFKTNILALNAAVEAARAGEAGQGFAVVADEVRSLANHTASAAQETTTLIKAALESIKQGTQAVDITAETLNSVALGEDETAVLIDNVTNSLHEKADRFAEVSANTLNVANLAQSNMSATELNIQAGQELIEQAKVLTAIVARVKLDADGINPLDQE